MSPDTDHQPNRDLDTTILTAAAELRAQVVGGEPSAFTPSPRRAPVAGALACVLVLLGGFALFRGGDDGPGDRTVAGPASTESGPAPLTDESGAGILDLAVLVSSPEPLVQAPLERPAAGESVVDPAFGTTITRITDAGSGESIVPIPSGQSAWNADESLLLLYRQGSGFELRDGRTGSP
ncbi:MAG: hypothetical protein GY929_08195, partial [Actinomycetia bacterium]|nr:hypothetical protein [Actinomycetes bacterium]